AQDAGGRGGRAAVPGGDRPEAGGVRPAVRAVAAETIRRFFGASSQGGGGGGGVSATSARRLPFGCECLHAGCGDSRRAGGQGQGRVRRHRSGGDGAQTRVRSSSEGPRRRAAPAPE